MVVSSWHVITPATLLLLLLLIGSLFAMSLCIRHIRRLRDEIKTQESSLRGFHVKAGNIAEQLAPLTGAFPWNPEGFKFLGKPIDGIQFEEDRIILVEFKTGQSKLSRNQRLIKRLVESREVYFEEVRIG